MRKGGGSSGSQIRGSGDIRAFADYTLIASKGNVEGIINVEHDKSRWDQPVPAFSVKFDIGPAGAIQLIHTGDFKKASPNDPWKAVSTALKGGDKTRRELITLVTKEDICKERKLDEQLKKWVDDGRIEKRTNGKKVIFSLIEQMEIPAERYAPDTDEPDNMFKGGV